MILPAGCEERCRACLHRELSPQKSLSQKEDFVRSSLDQWKTLVEPIRASEILWGYRTKSTLHAEFREGAWRFGTILVQGREEELIAIPNCPIHSSELNRAFLFFSSVLPPDMPLAFVSVAGELATLVVKAADYSFTQNIDWSASGLRGIYLNFNPAAGKRVTAPKQWKLIWGEGEIFQGEGWYGPASFQQQIQSLHGDSLSEAFDFLSLTPESFVLDLYSGTGRSLELWLRRGAETVGVELSGEAVRLARKTVGENKILQGKVSERIPQLKKAIQGRKQIFCYANPPRTGLEPEVLDWIAREARPQKIAYLSCSPGTLSKNLSLLTQAGYDLRRIIPYDFFPRTQHVEVLALLDLDADRAFFCPLDGGLALRSQ